MVVVPGAVMVEVTSARELLATFEKVGQSFCWPSAGVCILEPVLTSLCTSAAFAPVASHRQVVLDSSTQLVVLLFTLAHLKMLFLLETGL